MGRPLRRGHEHPVLAGTIVGAASAPPSWVGMPRRHLGGCSSAGRAPGLWSRMSRVRAPSLTPPAQPSRPAWGCCRWAGMMGHARVLRQARRPDHDGCSGALALVVLVVTPAFAHSRISDRSTRVTGRRSPLRRRHSPLAFTDDVLADFTIGRPAGTRWQPGRPGATGHDSRHRPPGPPSARQRALPDHLPRRQRRLPPHLGTTIFTVNALAQQSPSPGRNLPDDQQPDSGHPALGVTDRVQSPPRPAPTRPVRPQSDPGSSSVNLWLIRASLALIAAITGLPRHPPAGSILTGRGTDFLPRACAGTVLSRAIAPVAEQLTLNQRVQGSSP